MEQIIKSITAAPFGVCGFSAFAERLIPCRAVARLPKEPKSIICFAFPYKVKDERPENISRYAAVPDYHKVCGAVLEDIAAALKTKYPQNEFSPFTDNSPIPEVAAASAAGLGVIGKNGLLITPRYGSFVFIGEIVTDMAFAATDDARFCHDCGACRAACPVGLSKKDCLSALSQQKKPFTPDECQKIIKGGCVWGCDICQEVCPYNKGAELTFISEFKNGYRHRYVPGEDITGRAFEWRGEKVISRNARLFQNSRDVVAVDTTEKPD